MDNDFPFKQLNDVLTIAIYGSRGSGKTALSYKILEAWKDKKKIYFVNHPQPKMIEKLGFFNLKSLESMEKMRDCVIYWDEPQLTTTLYDKRSNQIIARVCSLARQRNITLIISSSDTRVFTKHNEAYFDAWIIKDIEYSMVKQGSKIKKIIKENTFIDAEGFRLEKPEFILDCRTHAENNGKHTFSLSKVWREDLSTPYGKV